MAAGFEEVDREITAGRLWRAKEMIQGRLAAPGFDPDVLEKYGQILLAMHDTLEAGRYLFASGRRRPDYVPAIELFLSRHRMKVGEVPSGLPKIARRHSAIIKDTMASEDFIIAGYPDKVLEELVTWKPVQASKPKKSPRHDYFIKSAMIAVLGIFVLSALIGFTISIRWLWNTLGKTYF